MEGAEGESITTHEQRDLQAKAGGSDYDDLSTQQLKDLLKGAGVNAAGAERKEELIALAHVHRIDPSIVAHKRNHLGEEKSPYLLQHAHNPVHWFAFGPTAFEQARKQDKPILISIGYATCHWCHVMERESFEDEQVAQLMNDNFISIKIDREELPDVDTIYMSAAQSMGVSGGWPLNVFVTPELKPFFAGTYFPKDHFMHILRNLAGAWKMNRSKLLRVADELNTHLNDNSTRLFGKGQIPLDEDLFRRVFKESLEEFDELYGGFGGAPKFPPSMHIMMLLRIFRRTGEKEALRMAECTLKRMAQGGLYDHLGGGFARYSTDRKWLIPHFEKMLYDNALLAQAYLEAYKVTSDPTYASIARETLDYVRRVMENRDLGGFYSAEDADSEGVEGKFYVWTKSEIESILTPEEAARFCEVYSVTERGNFEHRTNHLNLLRQNELDWSVKQDPLIQRAAVKLMEVRERRIHPLKDDKQLTFWNGLMISSMALAANTLGSSGYLVSAQRAAKFVQDKLYDQSTGTLLRRFREGEARFEGTLDDYAFLIRGLLQLYQADFNPAWVEWAQQLQQKQDELFWDAAGGGYFYTPQSPSMPLIVRTKDFMDGATPSANNVSAMNLLQLDLLTQDEEKNFRERAIKVVQAAGGIVLKAHQAFYQLLMAIDFLTDANLQVAIIAPSGEETPVDSFLSLLGRTFMPNAVVAMKEEDEGNGKRYEVGMLRGKTTVGGKVTVMVCDAQSKVCHAPAHSPADLARELEAAKKTYQL
jgi:uncharacterized protein YyaL (SSP411 family)